jgi:hypothetical protein
LEKRIRTQAGCLEDEVNVSQSRIKGAGRQELDRSASGASRHLSRATKNRVVSSLPTKSKNGRPTATGDTKFKNRLFADFISKLRASAMQMASGKSSAYESITGGKNFSNGVVI